MTNQIEELRRKLESINEREEGIFDFTLVEGKDCYLTIIDETEEFYYGGFAFDRILDELEDFIRELFGNKNLYLDCVCPGRWIIVE